MPLPKKGGGIGDHHHMGRKRASYLEPQSERPLSIYLFNKVDRNTQKEE